MNYWRIQLHPSDPEQSARHASESLAAGFIGLDFVKHLQALFPNDPGRYTPKKRD